MTSGESRWIDILLSNKLRTPSSFINTAYIPVENARQEHSIADCVVFVTSDS